MFKHALALVVVATLAACSGGPATTGLPRLATPASTSPGAILVAPMVKTAILPASAMTSRRPANTITTVGWSTVPGTGSSVFGAPDGSMWVLSDQPAGPDKYIWHYAGGTWTNISGQASTLAIAPDGTLYAVNSSGGTYAYSGGNWSSLGGGAVAIAAVADNSIFVLSNAGGPDHAIWHYSGGAWSQASGSGVSLVASFDTTTHGTIAPGGFYILNSTGQIYYRNVDASYVQIPGTAKALAPANGGLFVLSTDSAGTIYYYDIDGANWTAPGGSGVAIADASNTLYVLSAAGGIYTASAPTSNWPCNNAKFGTDQAAYANGTLKVSYIEENVCGIVTTVLPSKTTSSGLHGYYYVQLPSGYQIEIVCNLNAMKTAPATWPWTKTGDYSYVQGRYYYDNASTQGMDWTENDTGSWPTVGFVVINGNMYH